MKSFLYYFFATILFQTLSFTRVVAQVVPQGINYQGIAANASGVPITNKVIGIKIAIYSGSSNGILQWEETHSPTSNQFGLFSLVIGQGATTGNGAAPVFSAINWGNADHYMKVSIDINGGTAYLDMNNTRLLSVPYSFYSAKSGGLTTAISLNDLADVDTTGIAPGKTLKWNGGNWKMAIDNDSDTALYANMANKALMADTALFVKYTPLLDTAKFSYKTDSAVHSKSANTSINANHSLYSDTATYALNCVTGTNSWSLSGNTAVSSNTNFIGTINNEDFIIKTNNTERLRITSAGKIGVGIPNPSATFHAVGDDGMIVQGTFGSGVISNPGAGARMAWYPRKAAFRVGYTSGTQWDDANIGNYSIAGGFASVAKGNFAISLGKQSSASDSCSVAMGSTARATGKYAIALGNSPFASGEGAVAIGRGPTASGYASQAVGYHVTASGNYATAFGHYSVASGENSVAMGYHASTNNMKGSFVFSDYSSNTVFATATAPNQFMIKAAGGIVFYSDVNLTSGVSIEPGGGAWLTLSDKHKKENFRKLNGESILKKIAELEINSWNYKSQANSIRHLGPMAQDFYAAFGLGENDESITTTDIDGINMLAIQALVKRTKELNEKIIEIEQMKKKFNELERQKKLLEKRLVLIEERLSK